MDDVLARVKRRLADEPAQPDPARIAIACAAVDLVGKESDLFRFTVKHSLIFTCMVGLITTLQAYVLTWMIP